MSAEFQMGGGGVPLGGLNNKATYFCLTEIATRTCAPQYRHMKDFHKYYTGDKVAPATYVIRVPYRAIYQKSLQKLSRSFHGGSPKNV